jgi:histidinol-phosphate aminotransferase
MKFVSHLDDIALYEAGKPIELVVREFGIGPSDIIKLASNENPYGCSPKVEESICSIVSNMSVYPDDSMHDLKTALAKRFDVSADQLMIGAGSDQVIELAIRAKVNPSEPVLMNGVTFAMYEIYAKQMGATVVRTNTTYHDLEQFYALYQEHKPSVVFLCVPNNPSGDALTKAEVYDFIAKVDQETLVVVDGAYMEYAKFKDSRMAIDPDDLIATFPNTLYLGTFSKAYGLGGMRVGYGIAQANIISAMMKLRPPFNITTLSLAAAIKALEDEEHVAFAIEDNFKQMARYEQLVKKLGLDYIESYTNFITILLGDFDSLAIADALLRQGIIVRNLKGYGLNAIRITIGKPEQNDRALAAFEALITE